MLELYYDFFDKFCNVNNFEELEMDRDSFYLALAEENLYNCILPRKRAEWKGKQSMDCRDYFTADTKNNFSPFLLL